jgi:hypothetical protein
MNISTVHLYTACNIVGWHVLHGVVGVVGVTGVTGVTGVIEVIIAPSLDTPARGPRTRAWSGAS